MPSSVLTTIEYKDRQWGGNMSLEIEKKEIKKWKRLKNIGEGILAFGSAGFVGSVLSPFDFEGPVIEILTGLLAIGGFIAKKSGESHLEEIEGTSASWNDKDREELDKIKQNIEKTTEKRKEKRKER